MEKVKRAYRSLRRNFKNVYWWRDNILYNLLKLFDTNDGFRVLNEDWDSLIILDCCRYDTFEHVYRKRKMRGVLQERKSRGTWTVEFLKENFDEDCKDIVYVTSNPYVDKHLAGKFYKIIPVWKFGWNERFNTVLPLDVYKSTLKAVERYPEKRVISHFMQPHHPYLTLNDDDDLLEKIRRSVLYDETFEREQRKSFTDIYSVRLYEKFDIRRLKRAYRENLEIVMPYVELLLNSLTGRTVITSDHGESFGDRIHPLIPIRFYGHGFTRLSSLIRVPWLIVDEELKKPYRDPKELKKEICTIERRLGLRGEKMKVRRVVGKLGGRF